MDELECELCGEPSGDTLCEECECDWCDRQEPKYLDLPCCVFCAEEEEKLFGGSSIIILD